MKCFNHAEADAVAACVYCGKGLCRECATRQSEKWSVCSEKCLEGAEALEKIVQSVSRDSKAGSRVAGTFLVLSSVVFGGMAVYEAINGHRPELIILGSAISVTFVMVSYSMLKIARTKL